VQAPLDALGQPHIPDARYPELASQAQRRSRSSAWTSGRCARPRRTARRRRSRPPRGSATCARRARSNPRRHAVQVDRQVGVDEEVLVPRDGTAEPLPKSAAAATRISGSCPRRRRPGRRAGTTPPPARARRSHPACSSPSRTRSSGGRGSRTARARAGTGRERSSGGSANSMSATRIRSAVARTTSVPPASTDPSTSCTFLPGRRVRARSSIVPSAPVGAARSSCGPRAPVVRRRAVRGSPRATPPTGRRAAHSGPNGPRASSVGTNRSPSRWKRRREAHSPRPGAYGRLVDARCQGSRTVRAVPDLHLLDGKVALITGRRVGSGSGGVGAVRRARCPHRHRGRERRRRARDRRPRRAGGSKARPPFMPTSRAVPTTTRWSQPQSTPSVGSTSSTTTPPSRCRTPGECTRNSGASRWRRT